MIMSLKNHGLSLVTVAMAMMRVALLTSIFLNEILHTHKPNTLSCTNSFRSLMYTY